MSPIVGQPSKTTRTPDVVAAIAPADPGAVADFSARMAAGAPKANAVSADGQLATDEQLSKLQLSDLERLRNKWGGDEAGFRKEAYEFYQFSEASLDATMKQFIVESYQRMKDAEHERRNW